MASLRKAGARASARLAALFCLVFPLVSYAADDAAPFPEYEGDGRWSPIMAQAASWQMAANCAYEGYQDCRLSAVSTSVLGYVYTFTHVVYHPGGGTEMREHGGGSSAAWSCPSDFEVYTVFMGIDVGPYPNRMLDVGGPTPVKCKPVGEGMRSGMSRSAPEVSESFDKHGALATHDVLGEDASIWSVSPEATGTTVSGHGDRWDVTARIENGRAVSLGQGMTLVYDTAGALDTVRGLGGTVFSRALVNDPDGQLVTRLRELRRHLPSGRNPEPLSTLSRLAESIDALLDARPDPHAIATPPSR